MRSIALSPIKGRPGKFNKVRRRSRVLPAFRLLRSGTNAIGLGLASFEIGWKIGTGINAKFLRLGLPPKGTVIAEGWGTHQWAMPAEKGTEFVTGTNLVTPEDGFYWLFSTPNGQRWSGRVDTNNGCGGAHPPVPPDFTPITGTGNVCYINASISGGWRREGRATVAPIEDYVAQPATVETPDWNWSGPASSTEVENEVRAGLADAHLAEGFYAHYYHSQYYSDPTYDDEELRDCRPTDAIPNGDPAPLRGTQDFLDDPAKWQARYETVAFEDFETPDAAFPTEGAVTSDGRRAYMRWGWAAFPVDKPWIDWKGWGYRKIYAKHGWSPTARSRTVEALLAPSSESRNGEYREYILPERYDSRRGAVAACEWVVVVQYVPQESPESPERSQNAPMGNIISAHGRYVRPRP